MAEDDDFGFGFGAAVGNDDEYGTSAKAANGKRPLKGRSDKQAGQNDKENHGFHDEQDGSDGEAYFNLGEGGKSHQRKKKKNTGGIFSTMGFSQPILKALVKKGYRLPTPIQRKAIPSALQGRDLLIMARTGSGKTAAFLLPVLERLKGHSAKVGARALVITPTRELAMQTLVFAKEYGKYMDPPLRFSLVVGGDSLESQFEQLSTNPDMILATPGRLLHLLDEVKHFSLSSVESVVFDEADRLFELGLAEQLKDILRRLPGGDGESAGLHLRQTMIVSATLPKTLADFSRAGLKDPEVIKVDAEARLSENLYTAYFRLREEEKLAAIRYLCAEVVPEKEQALIFVATRHHAEFVAEWLRQFFGKKAFANAKERKAREEFVKEIKQKGKNGKIKKNNGKDAMGQNSEGFLTVADAVYGSMDQSARRITVAKFAKRRTRFLVVTDVAARGIDLPLLDNVINYHFPCNPKLFVHRVGRVARAGRDGAAFSLVSQDELPYVIDLHIFLGEPIVTARGITEETSISGGPALSQRYGCPSGILGRIPSIKLEAFDADVAKEAFASSSQVDLEALQKTMENAMEQYKRTRELPTHESIKKVKKWGARGTQASHGSTDVHPILKKLQSRRTADETKAAEIEAMENAELEREAFLDTLRSFRPSSARVVPGIGINASSFKLRTSTGLFQPSTSSLVDPLTARDKVDSSKKRKREVNDDGEGQRSGEATEEDDGFYLHSAPAGANEAYRMKMREREIGSSGNLEASVLNMVADSSEDMHKQRTQVRRWDRKKKKYVVEESSAKRKNESGFAVTKKEREKQGQAYKKWAKKHRKEVQLGGDQENTRGNVSVFNARGKGGWRGQDEVAKKKAKEELRTAQQIKKERKRKARSQGGRKKKSRPNRH